MKSRLNIAAVAVFALALIALLIFASNQQNVRRLQAGFLGLITPFLRSGSDVDRRVTAFREGMKTAAQLDGEVKALRVQNSYLHATNETLRGLEAENNRLRKALDYRQRSSFKLMPARIIGRDATTWFHSVTIDRGSNVGLRVDMPVVTEEGLVGKITIVSPDSSVVVLVSDENCKVSARVQNTKQDQGIVKGERTSTAAVPLVSMNFLGKQAALEPGMKVITSGIGGVFPGGITIGTVHEFKIRDNLDGYATLYPAVDLTTLEDLFVVMPEKENAALP